MIIESCRLFKAAVSAILMVSFLESCSPVDSVIPVSSVSVSPGSLSLDINEKTGLTVTVSPSDATDKTVTWTSDRPDVASVNDGGIVTALKEGTAIITAKAGDKSATCTVTVVDKDKEEQEKISREEDRLKAALIKIYDAMDGPNWVTTGKWDVSKPLESWDGVVWNRQYKEESEELKLIFYDHLGVKGEFPDCFDELTCITQFSVAGSGITGTLPPSFGRIKKLKDFSIALSSMTSLPDIFEGMPLEKVTIGENPLMSGPLPESLGSSHVLKELLIYRNAFIGKIPDSWASLGTKLELTEEKYLDEQVPASLLSVPQARYLVNMYIELSRWRTEPTMVGDYDIPAFWPDREIKDLVTGKNISFEEIASQNKVTVLLNWATWCPFSKELMPVLKKMYEKYHGDGLEIIAAFNADSSTQDSGKTLKEVLLERGYEQWYNFNLWEFSGLEWNIWCGSGTPSAVLVDKNGNIMTSSRRNVSDPSRNRFGYAASTQLIPILEEIFGPLEEDDGYSSTDYSQDGKVVTLQRASEGQGINVVFMGDAYTDKDIASGLYEQLMTESMEELFSIEPYKTYRNKFNVYAVKVVSENGKTGEGFSTALGTEATYGSISTGDMDKCFEYALKVPGINDDKNLLIGVLINSVSSRGICAMSESRQSGVAFYGSCRNEHEAFGITLRHEAGGHGFAFLDDEYGTGMGEIPQDRVEQRNYLYQKYGWYSNVDFTNDPSKVKWSAFLSDERYKDEVGVFEGGSLYQKGVYRPSQNSMMRDNVEYYNAPSRLAIFKRIMELSGEVYTFQKFLDYDAVNRNPSGTTSTARPPLKAAANISTEYLAPPVIVP